MTTEPTSLQHGALKPPNITEGSKPQRRRYFEDEGGREGARILKGHLPLLSGFARLANPAVWGTRNLKIIRAFYR